MKRIFRHSIDRAVCGHGDRGPDRRADNRTVPQPRQPVEPVLAGQHCGIDRNWIYHRDLSPQASI